VKYRTLASPGAAANMKPCHAERRNEAREAVPIPESKHPCPALDRWGARVALDRSEGHPRIANYPPASRSRTVSSKTFPTISRLFGLSLSILSSGVCQYALAYPYS